MFTGNLKLFYYLFGETFPTFLMSKWPHSHCWEWDMFSQGRFSNCAANTWGWLNKTECLGTEEKEHKGRSISNDFQGPSLILSKSSPHHAQVGRKLSTWNVLSPLPTLILSLLPLFQLSAVTSHFMFLQGNEQPSQTILQPWGCPWKELEQEENTT